MIRFFLMGCKNGWGGLPTEWQEPTRPDNDSGQIEENQTAIKILEDTLQGQQIHYIPDMLAKYNECRLRKRFFQFQYR